MEREGGVKKSQNFVYVESESPHNGFLFYRFVFTNSGALKLEKDVQFEVGGMDLTPYLSGPLHSDDSRPIFDMYGCVCHFGSIQGGHYTSYAKHLATGQVSFEHVG